MSRLQVQPGERVLFVGDSNTDTDYRTRARPLGYGYVMMVAAFLDAAEPGLGIEVVNRGNDGDTVEDLARRWQEDVLALDPDWLFLMIGTNDIGNRYADDRKHLAVDDVAFEQRLRALITTTRSAGHARIVLIEPPLFELPVDAAPNRDLEALCAILERIADSTDCTRVPVRAGMSDAHAAGYTKGWFRNVNHPAFPGHAYIAQQVLQHIGWSFG